MRTGILVEDRPIDPYSPVQMSKESNDLMHVALELGMMKRSLCKAEIEDQMRRFIETNLEYTDSGTLYVYLKQLEFAIKVGVENLKDQAFESLGSQLGGVTSGKFMGHDVVVAYPQEWRYSPAIEALKDRQKIELTRLQDEEKSTGIAKHVPGKARLTITLRER